MSEGEIHVALEPAWKALVEDRNNKGAQRCELDLLSCLGGLVPPKEEGQAQPPLGLAPISPIRISPIPRSEARQRQPSSIPGRSVGRCESD